MAQETIVKTTLALEYIGAGDKKGGTYTNSNIKPAAADDSLYLAAGAINDLQEAAVKSVYKVVQTELSE